MKKPVALERALSISPSSALAETFPAILRRAGKAACFAADEFFSARLSNPYTRRAYGRAVSRFLAWCEAQGIELRQVTPGLAGPKGTFRPYQCLEPQRWGYPGFLVFRFFPSRDGFDFGFLIREDLSTESSLLLLVVFYLFLLLVSPDFSPKSGQGAGGWFWRRTGEVD